MVEAVIFDIDGTILDSVDLHAKAWQKALSHFGFDLAYERVRHEIGKGGDQLLPALLPEDVVCARGEEIKEFRSILFKRDYLPRIQPFPRVRELFQRMADDGLRIALASSAKSDEIAIYKRIADIEDLVELEASADDAEKSKPHPDIFQITIERLGDVEPSAVIVVGDTPHDAEAASKAKLKSIGVLCGGFPEEELKAAGCLVIYRDPGDLLDHFESSILHDKSRR